MASTVYLVNLMAIFVIITLSARGWCQENVKMPVQLNRMKRSSNTGNSYTSVSEILDNKKQTVRRPQVHPISGQLIWVDPCKCIQSCPPCQHCYPCEACKPCQPATTTIAPPPRVAPGYEHFAGLGYYKLHTGGRTWDEARSLCEAEGAHLAIINSEAEASVLKQLLGRHPNIPGVNHNDFAFIGIHDRFKEGEFITVAGKSLQSTGFMRWVDPRQPDNAGGNENCGSVYRINGSLNDIPCHWKLAFICENEHK